MQSLCRKHFRPAYSKLNTLASLFPVVPILTLTATANNAYKNEIKDSVGMRDPVVVERNPDRPNLHLSVYRRPNSGDDKITEPLEDLAKELKMKREAMPRTLIYGNLEACGDGFDYFGSVLGSEQYSPPGAPAMFENRLFAQYHANYPSKYKDALVQNLINGTCKARIIFVTVAFGVGIDCQDVQHIVHIGIPCTIEDFFQEIGRAGRDGSNSTSVCYYNSHDISRARKALDPVMRTYITTTSCRREVILHHFQSVPLPQPISHMCCDNCNTTCMCHECEQDRVVAAVSDVTIAEPPSASPNPVEPSQVPFEKQLKDDLLNLRMSLAPTTTSLGISLTTGFSLSLVDDVIEKFHCLNSVVDVRNELPIFNVNHASYIWEVICKYKDKI